jgi:anti-sigma regulatory factor (Ser/Thr protein kinase)
VARKPSYLLPQDPRAARLARRLTRHQLLRWGLSEYCDTAELLVSELVSNALLHGRGPVRLSLRHSQGLLRCEVTDMQESMPEIRSPAEDDQTGRGLCLMDMMADEWGAYRTAVRGKCVWFELGTPMSLGIRSVAGFTRAPVVQR